jgi:hypothetical protein
MTDLRQRLEELADAATRDAATPGPAAALRRGRQRRRRTAAATASLLVVALVSGGLLSGRLAAGPELPTVSPPATLPLLPLARLEVQTGKPPAESVEDYMYRDLAAVVKACTGGSGTAEMVVAVRSSKFRRLVMVVAAPPEPGQTAGCWTAETFEFGGAGNISTAGATPVDRPLTAAGDNRDRYGTVLGQVTKQARRVRVEFRDGRPPLDLPVLDAGPRYPVNFFATFFPQDPSRPGRPPDWMVAKLTAIDAAGRPVASCPVGSPSGGLPHQCPGGPGG